MKRLRIYVMILTSVLFLLAPLRAFADSAPPVGQTVIREGDYAVELAQALGGDVGYCVRRVWHARRRDALGGADAPRLYP